MAPLDKKTIKKFMRLDKLSKMKKEHHPKEIYEARRS